MDSSGLTTSVRLLDRVKAGDPGAWDRFVALYTPLIDHWCRRAGLAPALQEDVRQEVFAAVAARIGGFRKEPGRGTFRGWLRVIAERQVVNARRKAPQEVPVGEWVLAIPDPEPGEADPEARLLFERALALVERDFEPATWQAFVQTVVDGRAAADVATRLGLTANAVYLAKARVLKRLREEFADFLDP